MTSIEEIYELFKIHYRVFTDSRKAAEGGLFFALKGESFDGNNFAKKAIDDGAHFAIVDRPNLANEEKCLLVDDVLSTLQQLANYHRKQLTIPVLGITGTNGKTTTKELIAAVLSEKYNVLATQGNFNNHIGVPLTLLSIRSEHEFAVIEMGANHPGEIDFLCNIAEPDYGIITNVGKAHLEGFGSFDGVKQTKTELYRFIAEQGKALFVNIDNEHLLPLVPENIEVYSYAVKNPKADLYGELANNDVFVNAKILFEKGWLYIKSKLTGAYNLENILAAARIGVLFGVDPLLIQKGIENYVPSNNRSQIVKKGTSVILVDCYNANPSSMEVSIQNFVQIDKSNKLMILGDMLELGNESVSEHQKLVDSLEESDLDGIILVGNEFAKTKASEKFKKVSSVDEIGKDVIRDLFNNRFVLLKGSRGIKLEKLLTI